MTTGGGISRGTNNLARISSQRTEASFVCDSRRTRDLSVVVVVVVVAALMCCCFSACAAAGPRPTRIGSQVGQGNGTVRCLPIAHDVLWKRLRLVASDFDRFPVEGTRKESDTPPPPPPPTPPTPPSPHPVLLTRSELTVLTVNDDDDDDDDDESEKSTYFASQNRLVSIEESARKKTIEPRTDDDVDDDDDDDGHLSSRRRRSSTPERDRRKRPLHHRRRRRRRRRRKPVDPVVLQETSWHCRMSKYWKRMAAGLFPAYVQTARCRQRVCMLGLFECRPRRYRMKLLRRNDGVCNPLPNLGPATAYEETWSFVEYKVVVGCECSRKRTDSSSSSSSSSGRFSSRRRNYTNSRVR